ncbi:hypothetical protein FE257_007154 [Aspergillus nanangensis]|uniref:Xylanolytic transcriptional activator regulatory domain-containing protein n=1 Tax=Aspergillus nanangensis TaxID=2582783 RepID=A0AAD4GUF4_ASPNN|nr:hypothetical protein FE257_007154 [Aspergillus nanangensis]
MIKLNVVRQRHAQSDSALPSCSNCVNQRLRCIFLERRKPGPSKGFIRADNKQRLLKRMEHLEYLLCQKDLSSVSQDRPVHFNFPPNTPHTGNHSSPSNPSPCEPDLGYGHDIPFSAIENTDFEFNIGGLEPGFPDPVSEPLVDFGDMFTLPTSEQQDSSQRVENHKICDGSRSYLLSLYMSMADQLFPLFPIIFDHTPLTKTTDSISEEALAHSICAVATTFPSNLSTTKGDLDSIGRSYFEAARSLHNAYMNSPQFSLDMATIKTSLLLAIYQITRLPSPSAWTISGETIRLAYAFGLDRVDASSQGLSPREAEDRRCLWWSLFFLDTFMSAIYCRPYAIDFTCVESNLPSTSYRDMVSGYVNKSRKISLGGNFTDLWRDVGSLQLGTSMADLQQLFFILLSFQREICKLRRSQCSVQSAYHELSVIRHSFASLRLALPDDLDRIPFSSYKFSENCEGERIQFETLLLLHQFVQVRENIEGQLN